MKIRVQGGKRAEKRGKGEGKRGRRIGKGTL
jgi:hypothetical protein